MKNLLKYALLVALIPFLTLSSCKKDNDDPVNEITQDVEFRALTAYLQANDLDLDNILDGWITTASNVNTVMTDGDPDNDYFIIDIRQATDYNAGHIEGATNSTLGNILTAATNAGEKKVLVVCYTGQTAAHGAVALRLSGHPDAQVMMWGMSGWTSTLDSWSANTDTKTSANWIASPGSVAENKEFSDPDLTVTATGGAEILAERVQALLTGGFKGIGSGDVLASPGNYFINNYWAAEDVQKYGNIAGAYRINPLTIAGGEFENLDPGKKILTYCWTGQTSSMITAYLTVLGYDAVSMKFGVNSVIFDNLEGHKFSPPATDLPVVQ